MYCLVSNKYHPTYPLARVFLSFVILSRAKCFFKGTCALSFVCVWKTMVNFSVLCFSCQVDSVSSLEAIQVQFSTFCSSRLPFRLVFDNLPKNFDNLSATLNALMTSNSPFTTDLSVIEIEAKLIHLYTKLSQHLVIWDSRESF